MVEVIGVVGVESAGREVLVVASGTFWVGCLSLGAWCLCQYASARAWRCLFVRGLTLFVFFSFLRLRLWLLLSGTCGRKKASRASRFFFFVAGESWAFSFARMVNLAWTDGEVERALKFRRRGSCVRHTLRSWASFSNCSNDSIHFGMSCSMLALSLFSNWTCNAFFMRRLSRSRKICPSHFHLRRRIAVTMS